LAKRKSEKRDVKHGLEKCPEVVPSDRKSFGAEPAEQVHPQHQLGWLRGTDEWRLHQPPLCDLHQQHQGGGFQSYPIPPKMFFVTLGADL
jgi:hypothetical protein